MLRKATLATAVCTVALLGTTASSAFAGEITGNGKVTGARTNSNSICSYSGQNDDPTAPLDGSGPNGPGGRTQNFGQAKKLGLVNVHETNPGDSCHGGSNPNRAKGK